MIVTLRDLVLAVSHNLRDCVEGTVTASGTTTTFTDSARIASGDNRFKYCDLIFIDTTGLTGPNPNKVASYAASTRIFTLAQAYGAGSPPAGTRYALLNIAGEGYPYQEIIAALTLAVRALGPKVTVDQPAALTVTSDANGATVYDYSVPAGFDYLTGVIWLREGQYPVPLRHGLSGWTLTPGTRDIHFNRGLALRPGEAIRLVGQAAATVPTSLTGTLDCDFEATVNATIEMLTRGGSERSELALAANEYMDRVRTVPRYRRAGAYKVG